METEKRLHIYDSETDNLKFKVTGAFLAKLLFLTGSRYCPFVEDYTESFDWKNAFFINEFTAIERAERQSAKGTTLTLWDMPAVAFPTIAYTILVTELFTVAPLGGFRAQFPKSAKARDLMRSLQSAAPDSVQFLIAPPTIRPAHLPFFHHVAKPKRLNETRSWRTRPIEGTTKQPLSLEPSLNLIRAANLWLQNPNAG